MRGGGVRAEQGQYIEREAQAAVSTHGQAVKLDLGAE
jgi:hypothetical protein